MRLDAMIVQAGGTGKRLGGVSKPDFKVGDRRLLDILLEEAQAVINSPVRTVVVGPNDLAVPQNVTLTLEDPPFGGPLAGIGAGVDQLADLPGKAKVLLAACDAPLAPRLLPALDEVLDAADEPDGVVPLASEGESFPNYLQGLYRLDALRRVSIECDGSIFRAFRALQTTKVTDGEGWLIDVDTPADARRLRDRLDGLR